MSGGGRYRKGHDTPPRGKAAAERWHQRRLARRVRDYHYATMREEPFIERIIPHRAWPDNQVR